MRLPTFYLLCLISFASSYLVQAQVPVLINRLPAANAVDASQAATIQLTFSLPMSNQAATADAVKVVSAWRGLLPGTYAGAGSSTILFTPRQPLLPGEPIQVKTTPLATSLAGGAAAFNDYQFRARTTGGNGLATDVADMPLASPPTCVVLADVDGDGKADMLVSNRTSAGTVTVELGNGQGGFRAKSTVAVGGQPASLIVRDVNGDGKLDLLTANRSTHTASVRLGDGQGGFTGTTEVRVGDGPISIATGDVNGDGKLDLLTANTEASNISVRFGNGNGEFIVPVAPLPTEIPVDQAPSSLAVGDVNGDGYLDLLTTNTGLMGLISLRFGNSQGRFTAAPSIAISQFPRHLLLSDVNKDAKLDILAVCADNFERGSVDILLGKGLGAFTSMPPVKVDVNPSCVAVGDVNGDTNLDLLTANADVSTSDRSSVSVQLGNGQGHFSGLINYSVGLRPRSLAVGELNGDGRLDLLTVNDSGGGVYSASVRLGNGKEGFVGFQELVVGTGMTPSLIGGCRDVAVADVNQDGELDFVTANPGANTASVRLGDGAGNFRAAPDVRVGRAPGGVAVGDVNNDGKLDLVTANTGSVLVKGQTVSVRLGDGQGGFAGTTEIIVGLSPLQVVLYDVNGDSNLDLLTPNYGQRSVSVRLGDGRGGFTGNTEVATAGNPDKLAIGDVNEDGKPDLISAEYNDSESISICLGDGQGRFPTVTRLRLGQTQPISITIGDINSDGHLDFVAATRPYNGNTTTLSVWVGNGKGQFSGSSIADGGHYRDVTLGDMNGDGKLDLALVDDQVHRIILKQGDGQGRFSPLSEILTSSHPYTLALGDVDSDGDLDMLAAGFSNGVISLRFNGGSGTVLSGVPRAGQVLREAPLSVFPNPGHAILHVQNAPARTPAGLFDTWGRLVREFATLDGPLNIAGIAPGLYVLRCGNRTARLVVD